MNRLARGVHVAFVVLVAVWAGLLLLSVVKPNFGSRILAIGNPLLVLATMTYAWLTFSLAQQAAGSVTEMKEGNRINQAMIREMRESRRQAATPVVRVENGGGSIDRYKFVAVNVGNSPAINIEIGIAGMPAEGARSAAVLARRDLLVSGDKLEVETSLVPYSASSKIESYHLIVTYNNVLGESIEAVTVYTKGRPEAWPHGPIQHLFTRGVGEDPFG